MELINKNKIYFEVEEDCDNFKKYQKCIVRKYFDRTLKCYYLILVEKRGLFKEERINLKSLDFSTIVFSNYCNLYYEIKKMNYSDGISKYERNFNTMAMLKFEKHIDNIRQRFDI